MRSAILRAGLEPASVVLEITETSLTQNAEDALVAIQSIRDSGTRVFLDDFGSGYSSFGILHEFSLDGIKLDRTFLESAASTRRAAACIHSVVTLARSLGMDLIAEGIESYDQVALLQSLGCEIGQGFLFAHPLKATEIIDVITDLSPAARYQDSKAAAIDVLGSAGPSI